MASLRVAQRLARLAPTIPLVHLCVAKLAISLGDPDAAVGALSKAVANGTGPRSKDYSRAANLLTSLNELQGARMVLEQAHRAEPGSARTQSSLGELARIEEDVDAAIVHFGLALELASSRSERLRALSGLAMCFTDASRQEEARTAYRQMIDMAPDHTLNHFYYVNSHEKLPLHDEVCQAMLKLLRSGRLQSKSRMSLHYGLGKIYDRHKRYSEAFAHFSAANIIRSRFVGRFDEDRLRSEVTAKIAIFNGERIADLGVDGDPDDFLICIVGMPRSGTTLLEQILSAHPDVTGLGERIDFQYLTKGLSRRLQSRQPYPACCEKMTAADVRMLAGTLREQLRRSSKGASRVFIKSPGDTWEVGLIKILFPNARLIHSKRHPVDTCLSCFMQNFQAVDFATDLNSLAATYRAYRRIMAHWSDVLPMGQIFPSHYEVLVTDPESTVRSLHEFCGLTYNDAWTDFSGLARRVDTASKWQVRRPLYRSSVRKWENYAEFLGPLLELVEEEVADDSLSPNGIEN